MDNFKQMFEMQKELQEKLGNKGLPENNPHLIRMFALGLFAEIGELLQENKSWKEWKTVDKLVNTDGQKKELADCWLFLIDLTLALGYDSEETYELINNKNKIVKERNNFET